MVPPVTKAHLNSSVAVGVREVPGKVVQVLSYLQASLVVVTSGEKALLGSWQGLRTVFMTQRHTWAMSICKAIYTRWMLRSSILSAESLPLSCAPLKLYTPLRGENGECIPHFPM